MQDRSIDTEVTAAAEKSVGRGVGMPRRAFNWTVRVWRSAASVVAVALALLLGWHVVNGKHGLSVWEQKRLEDKQLQKEIQQLQDENARLHVRVEKLKSDPDAIEHEAREKLRYARQGEVIVDLSGETKPVGQNVAR